MESRWSSSSSDGEGHAGAAAGGRGLPRIRIPTGPRLCARALECYRPVKTLQRRGDTAVFAVQEKGSGSPAVVKVSPAHTAGNAVGVYEGLNHSPHPGLMQSKAVFFDEGTLHVVLPWVSGSDLCDEVLGAGPLVEGRARRIARQLADALSHLHGVIGVAHLDISPENVLLAKTKDGDVATLIDYGSCRPLAGAPGSGGGRVAVKTQYAAPELLRALQNGGAAAWAGLDLTKADVFGLGVALFVGLFGFPPFGIAMAHDPHFKTLQEAGVRGLLAKVGRSGQANAVSPGALALLDGMLKANPVQRLGVLGVRSHPWLLASR